MLRIKQIGTICFAIFSFIFSTPTFATNIPSNASTADCKNNPLQTYSGTSNLQADWQANTIQLHWYEDSDATTEMNVASASQSCVYDGILTPPATIPTKTGYTFKGWTVRGLPDGYTKLQYIESNGTQYIDIGVKGNQDTKVDIDFIVRQQGSTGAWWPFGARTTASSKAFALWSTTGNIGGGFRAGFDNTSGYNGGDGSATAGTRFHVTHSKEGTYINDSFVWSVSDYTDFTTPYNLLCFAVNDNGTVHKTDMAVYSLKLWQNNEVVRNFIPAKNSSNVVGMWDTVTKTFFTNAGTGSFTAGPAVQ